MPGREKKHRIKPTLRANAASMRRDSTATDTPRSPCSVPEREAVRVTIRHEEPADRAAVHAVNVAAFERSAEADLVDHLRDQASPIVTLVAERDGDIVGHILFTPVTVDGDGDSWAAMALGPMAVRPDVQRQGVGRALVKEGLRRCKELNVPAVFVLGHPDYYPRFGFEPASRHGCRCQWDVPDDVFMVRLLRGHNTAGGLVQYHKAFDAVT